MPVSPDLRKVLLFMNQSLGVYLVYMGLRALWAVLSLSVITVLLLTNPSISHTVIITGSLILSGLYFSLRWVAGRMEKKMMIRFRDFLFSEEAERDAFSRAPVGKSRDKQSRDARFLSELAGQPADPERVRVWRRQRRALRFRNWMTVILILIPFVGLAFALTIGMPDRIRLFAFLAATFLGGGFSGGLLTPVYSLLLVSRLNRGDH